MTKSDFESRVHVYNQLIINNSHHRGRARQTLAIYEMQKLDLVNFQYQEKRMATNCKDTPKPHKHHDLIVAWAKGAEIEERKHGQDEHGSARYSWEEVRNPHWYINNEYRIKPTPKPDTITYGRVFLHISKNLLPTRVYLEEGGTRLEESDNVKFVFDGETNKLKEVVIL
jgi:hypothetical protein